MAGIQLTKRTKGWKLKERHFREVAKTVAKSHFAPIIIRATRGVEGTFPYTLWWVDAEKDNKSAKEAGMKVISIPSQYTKDNNFSQANAVVQSAGEISLESV